MTDAEFHEYFKKLTDRDILVHLGKIACGIHVKSGSEYTIAEESDIIATVEQELYKQMSGRE